MRVENDVFLKEYAKRLLRSKQISFIDFVVETNPNYVVKWFHEVIADKLQQVRERKIKKLMLFVPPQHGKSQLSSRFFPAYCLGKNPNEKICVASYSSTLAESFSADIQRIIETDEYKRIFDIRLPSARNEGKKTTEKFDIVGGSGYVKAVGRGGSLTGTAVDIGIIDDPLKDRLEAQSITIREGLWGWYKDVFETRLHNDSVQIVIQTRWHQEDLSGKLLERDGYYSEENKNGWEVVKFPAIREKDINSYDPRNTGDALWEERHSLERLEKIKQDSPITFNSLYQQDPKPSDEALVFPIWIECDVFPNDCQAEFYGLDFGFTNDPTALVKIGKINNRLYLQEIIYAHGLTNQQISERMQLLGVKKNSEIFADSAEPKSIAELRRLGWNIKEAVKGKDSINAGISKLNEFEVYYTKSSVNIKNEIRNYQWIMQGNTPTNEPIDDFNHIIDAIRYGVYTKYGKPARKFHIV